MRNDNISPASQSIDTNRVEIRARRDLLGLL